MLDISSLMYTFKQMLGFEAVTLVPFEAKLIDTTLLSQRQCDWLNAYHNTVRQVVGNELLQQDRQEAYEWLQTKTEGICIHSTASTTITATPLMTLLIGIYVSVQQQLI